MFYLVDRASSNVKASYQSMDQVPFHGFRVIDVPDSVAVDEETSPLTLTTLLNQKYGGVLAQNPQFSFVAIEDMTTSSIWDLADPNVRGGVGNGSVFVFEFDGVDNGRLATLPIDVSADGSFDRFVLHWEIYSVSRTDLGRRTELTYEPYDPDSINLLFSNDNGTTFLPALFEEEILFPNTGNQLIVAFENNDPSRRYYLGSFGILY